ncbi:MAG: hypothetical protein M3R02_30945 [Chloroflexota bacterium]|nr:hypothetical protein [Chloroflexota bacterium]
MPGSTYEDLTLHALKALFPAVTWQERVRPKWLRWPVTGNKLELDLYHEPFRLAVEVQGPHHFRSVAGLADAEHSQKQQDRDTWKRHRCADLGIRLWTVSIFDLSEDRLYRLYLEMHQAMPIKSLPLTRMAFSQIAEVQAVVKEADRLSRRKVRPYQAKPKRKPGFIPLIKRLLGGS